MPPAFSSTKEAAAFALLLLFLLAAPWLAAPGRARRRLCNFAVDITVDNDADNAASQ